MRYTRRDFGKLALAALPAAGVFARTQALFGAAARPDSVIKGVHVGTITYSYRSMPDQSAEAILRYVVDSGISAIEFMGGPVEAYAGAPQVFRVPFGTRPNAEQHGQGNLAWGTGDTPITQILQLVRKNGWTMPACIELEYEVPAGSDAVKEVTKCLAYCRQALA